MNKFYLLIVFVFLFAGHSFAQTGELSGTVLDVETNEPISSVTVRIDKGKGTITDAIGKYKLSLPEGPHEIRFSSIGFKNHKDTVIIKAGGSLKLDVKLKGDVFKLNEVVSVSQYKKNASKETVSTAVITKEQIKNTNSNDLGEVVNKTPGVLVQDGQVSIRGGSSYAYGVGSRTTLLVDGLELSSADLGQTQNTFVPLENVKQVEVIKGASSVIYGSSALNGIVNVITEWPTDADPKTEIETNLGVYDKPNDLRKKWWDSAPPFFGSLNATHSRRIKDVQVITGGNISYNSSYLQNDNFWRLRGFIKTRYISPKIAGLSFGGNASFQVERADQFFISQDLDSLALVPVASSSSEYNKVTIDPHLNYSNIKGHNYKMQIRYINIFREGAGVDIDAVSHGLIVNNQYQYRFKKDLLIVTAGLPFNMGYSQSNLYQKSGKHFNFNLAAYLQAEFNYKILSLQGGMRYEIAGLDSEIHYGMPLLIKNKEAHMPVFRAGMNIQASKSTNIRLSWGQGFRIPSIAEKYLAQPFTSGVLIVPNDTLRPETGWNLELGIQQGVQIKDWKLGVDFAFFWQEYKNFIEYNVGTWPNAWSTGLPIFPDSLEFPPNAGTDLVLGPRPLNIENARIAGYEIGLISNGKIGPVGLRINAGYTYNFPTTKDNDTGSAHYSTGQFIKDMFAYNAKRIDTSDPVNSRLLANRLRHLFRGDIELSYWKVYMGATFYYASTPEKIPMFFKAASIFIFKDANALEKYLAKHGNGDFAMDIRAGIKVNDHFSMGFIVKNVTNHLYSLRPGRPEPIRNFTFQFRYNF